MSELSKDIIRTGKIVIVGVLLTLGVNAFAQWSGPTGAPPSNNTPAPVNVSNTNQIKGGGLTVNANAVAANGLNVSSGLTNLGLSSDPTGVLQKLRVFGKVGTDELCDRNFSSCASVATLRGVEQIVAGERVTLSPANGLGTVTVGVTSPEIQGVVCSGGTACTCPSGFNAFSWGSNSSGVTANFASPILGNAMNCIGSGQCTVMCIKF
jgi:hypothetical protein